MVNIQLIWSFGNVHLYLCILYVLYYMYVRLCTTFVLHQKFPRHKIKSILIWILPGGVAISVLFPFCCFLWICCVMSEKHRTYREQKDGRESGSVQGNGVNLQAELPHAETLMPPCLGMTMPALAEYHFTTCLSYLPALEKIERSETSERAHGKDGGQPVWASSWEMPLCGKRRKGGGGYGLDFTVVLNQVTKQPAPLLCHSQIFLRDLALGAFELHTCVSKAVCNLIFCFVPPFLLQLIWTNCILFGCWLDYWRRKLFPAEAVGRNERQKLFSVKYFASHGEIFLFCFAFLGGDIVWETNHYCSSFYWPFSDHTWPLNLLSCCV